jgi:hypothetical protein
MAAAEEEEEEEEEEEDEDEDDDEDDKDDKDEEAAAGAVCSRRSETRGISARGLLRPPRGAAAPRAARFRHGFERKRAKRLVVPDGRPALLDAAAINPGAA